jgi:hypothetical protein
MNSTVLSANERATKLNEGSIFERRELYVREIDGRKDAILAVRDKATQGRSHHGGTVEKSAAFKSVHAV